MVQSQSPAVPHQYSWGSSSTCIHLSPIGLFSCYHNVGGSSFHYFLGSRGTAINAANTLQSKILKGQRIKIKTCAHFDTTRVKGQTHNFCSAYIKVGKLLMILMMLYAYYQLQGCRTLPKAVGNLIGFVLAAILITNYRHMCQAARFPSGH